MKKFYSFLFAAVALVGFAACNSDSTEEPAPAQQVGKMEFTANIGEDTKTQLTEGTKVKWCAGDAIAISNGTVVKKYEIKSEMISDNGKTATFEGDPMDGDTFYAVYPYAEDAAYTDGKWNVTIPTEQVAVAGSFAHGAALAYGEYQGDYTFSFTNENAVLKFQVPENCSFVEFYNGEDLAVELTGGLTAGKDYYAVVAPGTYTFTVRIDGYLSKKSEKGLVLEKNTIYNLKALPKLERFSWGLVGEHQGWDISNPSSMYKVDENVYAALNQTLKANGFKFAKVDGAASWGDNKTNFGAWKKSSGKEYFNFMTEMPAGSWYGGPLYSDNAASDQQNIGVTDFNKSYDIYLAVTASGNWGIGAKYTIVEAGTAVTYPF